MQEVQFKVGDIFRVCDKGFDFVEEIRENQYSTTIKQSSFFKDNHLKYLEIIKMIKHGKKKKFKVKLFCENKKLTSQLWYSYSRPNEPQELYKWLYPNILNRKIRNGAIKPASWADIAKESLLEGDPDGEK